MITLDEFQEGQQIRRRKNAPRPQKHSFDFTGIIKCGECGCAITAEIKKKFIKTTKEYKVYTYYHCTRRKIGSTCTQKEVITEDNLVKEILDFVDRFAIEPQFLDWALEHLKNTEGKETEKANKVTEMQEDTLRKTENQLGHCRQTKQNF
ncbi:MAG: hypothetical protein A3I29_04865 [Candidatus Magasanikbacteria bacterium RIFCSPLOWO2_02_FULL_44_11]|uniref:Recombinase zinc beta ribbon domain-containing protein n=1 Tax=Candidatus Magasanikbacteria bacterium RIFCSPLOWO2_02_FULL_44_11 TaxID=1798689 RepID=A0A1F6NAK5_9BACT|nr:MAG: hypothetical protein A3I29_04865 [Candidatus Magasanikbacteria bacterium RIFCSPLOWO2_02_FULL_44_11]